MAGQSIDEAFAAIIKDCQAVAVEAVKNAAKKAQNDIVKEANSYLQKYYNNYKPRKYKRKYKLNNAINPILEDNTSNDSISIEVGVEYDSTKLKGLYTSNSRFHQSGDVWRSVTDHSKFSPDNGIPQPEWIMNNFLEGIHPITERNGDNYIYNPQKDTESTNSLMEDFFDTQLLNHIEQYVQNELFDAIVRRL